MAESRTPRTDAAAFKLGSPRAQDRGAEFVVVPAYVAETLETELQEAVDCVAVMLPYLEGLADKLKIAANSPEVIELSKQIIRARMILAARKEKHNG